MNCSLGTKLVLSKHLYVFADGTRVLKLRNHHTGAVRMLKRVPVSVFSGRPPPEEQYDERQESSRSQIEPIFLAQPPNPFAPHPGDEEAYAHFNFAEFMQQHAHDPIPPALLQNPFAILPHV
jgi:hypothetical protein